MNMDVEVDKDDQQNVIWAEKSCAENGVDFYGSNLCSLKNHFNVMKEFVANLEIHHPDVRIVCSEGAIVETHRLILAAASPNFLKPLLVEAEDSDSACIVCPDVSEECMNRVLRLLYYGETSLDEHFSQCLDVLASLQLPLHKMVVEVRTKRDVTSFIKNIPGQANVDQFRRQPSKEVFQNNQPFQTFLIRRMDGGLNLSENLSSNSSSVSIVDKCQLENDICCETLTLKFRNEVGLESNGDGMKQQKVWVKDLTDTGRKSSSATFQTIMTNLNDDNQDGNENDSSLMRFVDDLSTNVRVQHEKPPKSENPIFCNLSHCQRSFKTEVELRIHSQLDHKVDTSKPSDPKDSNKPNIQCQTCKKSFRSSNVDSSSNISLALNGVINCQQCDIVFNSWTCFTDHLQKVHGNAPKIVVRYKGPGPTTQTAPTPSLTTEVNDDLCPPFGPSSQTNTILLSPSNVGLGPSDNNLLLATPKIILGEISANQGLFSSNQKWFVQSGQHFNGKICLGLATVEPGADSSMTLNGILKGDLLNDSNYVKLTENMINQQLSMLKPNLEVMKADACINTMKRPPKTGDKVIECQICRTTLKSTKSYKRHMDQCHSSGRPKHVCILCQRTFKRSDNLTAHYRSVHCGLKPNNCACGKGYRTKNELLRHCRNSCPSMQAKLKLMCSGGSSSSRSGSSGQRPLSKDQTLNIAEANNGPLLTPIHLVTSSSSPSHLYTTSQMSSHALSPPQAVCSSMPSPQAMEGPGSSSSQLGCSSMIPDHSQIVSSTISSPQIVDSSMASPRILNSAMASPQIVASPESLSSLDSGDKSTNLDCIVDQDIDLSHGYFSDLDFDYDVTATNDLMQF